MRVIDLPGARRFSQEGLTSSLLELLLKQIPSGLLVLEAPSGRPLLANSRMAEIWGESEEWIATQGVTWKGFRPDGTPYAPEDWPHARALRGDAVTQPEEMEIVRRDGTRALVRTTAVPLRDDSGRVVAVVVNALDVSEGRRRYTARKFLNDAARVLAGSTDEVAALRNIARLAVPTLADWCMVDLLDSDGGLRRVAVEHVDRRKARAAAELARRYPPSIRAEAGVGKAVREGRSELVSDVTPEQLDAFASNPAHRRLLQELGIRSVMFVPLVARGRTLGAIGFVATKSQRRYTADDLEIAEELASRAALAIDNSRLIAESRAASEAKSDFLAIMSHELRTPLTAIIGYAELLQLGVPEPVTPRQHEQAERIEVSARHLLQLIEEILTLVSLDSGESRVRGREVDVNEIARRAVSVLEPMARAKGLPIQLTTADSAPVVHSDPDKILQILLNLLSNAIKFTESGEISVAVTASDGACTIEVRDTGIGLDDEHLHQIYEPFWQVERPITRKAGGTGLGLTIVRRLVEMLGGEIAVDSEVGKGSAFRVSIPLQQAGEQEAETASAEG